MHPPAFSKSEPDTFTRHQGLSRGKKPFNLASIEARFYYVAIDIPVFLQPVVT